MVISPHFLTIVGAPPWNPGIPNNKKTPVSWVSRAAPGEGEGSYWDIQGVVCQTKNVSRNVSLNVTVILVCFHSKIRLLVTWPWKHVGKETMIQIFWSEECVGNGWLPQYNFFLFKPVDLWISSATLFCLIPSNKNGARNLYPTSLLWGVSPTLMPPSTNRSNSTKHMLWNNATATY